MREFFSYLWPTTKSFSSEINGTLEVTYINGKKVLDSENANYSYGSLQKIMEFGLAKIDLQKVENLLLLGMGGGSIIKTLRNNFEYYNSIVAIEIDPEIIKLAREEFGINNSGNLKIIHEDALDYVKKSEERFELIVIDLFIDTQVPPLFYGEEFCKNVSHLMDKNSSIIFNTGINLQKESEIIKRIISNFGNEFKFKIFKKVNRTNTLLIGMKKL